jgi:hypothetical protein
MLRSTARRGSRWAARWLGAALALLLGLTLIALFGLWLRLQSGPVSLTSLAPAIERFADRALGSGVLSVRDVEFGLGGPDGLTPTVTLTEFRLSTDGRVGFSAPEITAALDAGALLGGTIRPTAIEIVGANGVLTRQRDGRFRFGLASAQDVESPTPRPTPRPGADGEAGPAFDAFETVLAQVEGRADGPLSALRRLSFERLGLRYVDYDAGRIWRGERADLTLDSGQDAADGRLRGRASVTLHGGGFGPMILRAEGVRLPDGGAAMTLIFSGVATRDLVEQIPALDGLQVLDAPLQGRTRLAIDGGGALTAFAADLRAGAGALGPEDAALEIDSAALAFTFDPASQRFDVAHVRARGPAGSVDASGLMTVSRDGPDPDEATGVTAELSIHALTAAHPDLFAAPQRFDAGAATLAADLRRGRVEVIHAALTQGDLRVSGRGVLTDDSGDDLGGEARLSLRGLEARQLVALWPLPVAPGARVWLDENLEAGHIPRADFAVTMEGGAPQVHGDFDFQDVVAHYLRPMPPITDGRGYGEVSLQQIAVAMDSGRISAPDGGEIAMTDATLVMPDVDDPLSTSFVQARATGPAGAALALLATPPLALPQKVGLAPDGVEGAMTLSASMTLPLLKDLRIEQIAVAAEARIADAAAVLPGTDLRISAPELTVDADTTQLTVSGDVAVAGLDASVTLQETFDPDPGAPSTTIAFAGRATTEQARDFGLDLNPYVDGAVAADGAVALYRDGAVVIETSLDLADATVAAQPLAWSKPAGSPLAGAVRARLEGSRVSIERMQLRGGGLTVSGSAQAVDGALRELTLTELTIDDRLDGSLTATRDADGLTVDLDARLLDFRLIDRESDAGAAETGSDRIALTLDVERLAVTPALALRDAQGSATQDDGVVEAQLDATLPERGGAVSIRYRRDATTETAVLRTSDFGGLLRAADIFGQGVGGDAAIDVAIRRDGPLTLQGELEATDFVVSDDPGLRGMLSATDLEAASQSGTPFDTIRAPFTLRDGRVTLGETVAYGPVIGVTLSGAIAIDESRVDIDGVFTPAYSLNAAVGNIPVLGDLLTGGEGRGLLAFNFSLTGPIADPTVQVNPLSVLTPGFLRDLFSGEPGSANTPAVVDTQD